MTELKTTQLENVRSIAKKIKEEIEGGTDQYLPYEDLIKLHGQFESYEVNTDNIITGINIRVGNMQLTIGKTIEKDIFEVYADDQSDGTTGTMAVDTKGDINNILKFFVNYEIPVAIYDCKLSAIGKFYKPNNNSKLNQLDNTDKQTLIYLLEFLQKKNILELKEDINEISIYDRLADVLIEWNTLDI